MRNVWTQDMAHFRSKFYGDVEATEARSLSLWERVGVRGYGLSFGRNPSPGSQERSDLSQRERWLNSRILYS